MTLGTYGHLFDQGGGQLVDIMQSLREAHRNGRQQRKPRLGVLQEELDRPESDGSSWIPG